MVTTASYEARKHGVRSGMAGMCFVPNNLDQTSFVTLGFIAKKLCPELIYVSHHFPRYMEMSNRVMEIFKRYDPTMQPAGCDEGYLK